MSFGQPLWFWALALIPALLGIYIRNEQQSRQRTRKLVAARLQDRLAGTVSFAKRRGRFALLLAGLTCGIIALAQPRAGYTWEQSKRKGRDVLIAIDVSKSMLATDLAPNRLTRAKLAAQDLINALGGDRVGLIAFAGTAFLQAPLTVDYTAVLGALNELDTEIIPQGGTNIAAAIKTAAEAFGKGESDHRALIIFTDGEDLQAEGEKSAQELKGAVRIFTVGLGSPEGSLIPLPNGRGGEFIKDAQGQIVKSRLDETRLSAIADSTGGFYVRLQNGRVEANRIISDGLGKMTEQDIDAKLSRQPIERYQLPLAIGIGLLAASTLIGERKRATLNASKAAVVFLFLMLLQPVAQAKNRGLEAYEKQDFKGAMGEFTQQLQRNPNSPELQFGLGSAAYKAGDLEQALQSFSKAVTASDPGLRAKAEYNLGNTLYQRGVAHKEKAPKIQEWKNAIQHYDQTLKLDPNFKQAGQNREVISKLIAELEKETPKNDQKDKKDEKKDDKKSDQKDQKDQKSDSKDGKDQEKKDSEKKPSKDGKDSKEESSDKDDANKESDGKEGEPKESPGKEGESPEEKDGKKPKDDKPGENEKPSNEQTGEKESGKTPEPMPGEPKKPREGELKSAPEYGGKNEGPTPDAEQAAEELAAAEGKMTEQQAKNLLESLKNDDQRVQLIERARAAKGPDLKDW